MELDLLDKNILCELDRDARQSIRTIAKKARANKDTVKYRIDRMEEEGIIEGYYPVVDAGKIGYTAYRIYLQLQRVNPEIKKKIAERLLKNKQIFFVVYGVGRWDVIILIWTKHVQDVHETLKELKEAFPAYIGSYELGAFAHLTSYTRGYLGKKREEEVISKASIELTETEWDILESLADEGRKSYVEVSQEIGITAQTIASKVRELQKKGVIKGFRAKINYRKIGRQYYKLEVNVADPAVIPALKEFARGHPDIIFINHTIGGSDFEFDCELEGSEALLQLIDDLQERFSEHIMDVDYFMIHTVHKINHVPKNR